jgi:uncharacterized membrane protein
MFRRISITLATVGFDGFMTVFGLVVYHKPDPHTLMWPMLSSTTMMALGMIGVAITLNSTRKGQVTRQ